jgi:hypothetical protein
MTKGYGYNADILNMLNLSNFRVVDVGVEPVYGEEQSKIRLHRYIPKVSALLTSLFFKRMTNKYMLRDFYADLTKWGFVTGKLLPTAWEAQPFHLSMETLTDANYLAVHESRTDLLARLK